MEDQNPPKFKSALTHGLLLGLVLLVISILIYLLELTDNVLLSMLSYLVFIVGVFISIKKFRDINCNGYISYGSALGYGTLVGLFAAIFSSIGTFIYLTFIDPNVMQVALENAEQKMIEQGNSDEEIEMAMSIMENMMTPTSMMVMGILMFTVFAFIISLIAGAILKKESNPFEERA